MNYIEQAIDAIDKQILHLQRARDLLTAGGPGQPNNMIQPSGRLKRTVSEATKQRIKAAQGARWAKRREEKEGAALITESPFLNQTDELAKRAMESATEVIPTETAPDPEPVPVRHSASTKPADKQKGGKVSHTAKRTPVN
jgi:hypothetical protein